LILLLDAHALLWWLNGGSTLSAVARAAIAEPANETLVSAATVWELAIKQGLGKLKIDADLLAEIDRVGFSGLPVTMEDGNLAGALPRHHKDPFDRMLVAQAKRLDALIVTRDRAFSSYDIKVITA
jgi:PIN domain nuclease of toxin-antitoxin system